MDTDEGYMEENYFGEIRAMKRIINDDMVYIYLSESEE